MDTFKQVGKSLRKNREDTEQNTRRIAENYPMVEAKVDNVIFDHPYKMEFLLTKHPHSVSLNLFFRPPVNCFQCRTGSAPIDNVQAQARGWNMIEDGSPHPVTLTEFTTNVGGFDLNPVSGGFDVPRTGVYNFTAQGDIGGLTVSTAAALIISIRVNGQVIVQKVWSVENGKLPIPANSIHINPNMYGLCLLLQEGDNVALWVAAAGIGFFNADFQSYNKISLIALA